MDVQKIKFYTLIVGLFLIWTDPALFHDNALTISLVLFGYLMIEFAWNMGRRINALDFMAIYALVVCLLTPAAFYYLDSIEWYQGYTEMAVSSERYFEVAAPGVLALIAGFNFPFKATLGSHLPYFEKTVEYLKDKEYVGKNLFWIGMFCTLTYNFMPAALVFFVVLGSFLVYIGALYIWYSEAKGKIFYLLGMIAVPLSKTLEEGMFGELVFISIFILMFVMMKRRINFAAKLGLMLAGFIFILFIQSVKLEVRTLTWYDTEKSLDYKLELYQRLAKERMENTDLLFGSEMLSGALDRSNQGAIVAMAIQHTPASEPYANGETIFLSTLASVVPRFMWENKPTAGGRENMIRFTGFVPVGNTSMDIGQLGDAYVNFGPWGGAIFLFFYGLFFALIYAKIFEKSETLYPSLILWIPLFYTGVVHADTSVLVCLTHIIKVSMFVVIFIIGYEKILGQKI